MKHHELVEVEWIDSTTAHGWTPGTELATPEDMHTRSAGIVIAEDEDTITIAMGVGFSKRATDVLCPLTIPRFAVKGVYPLRRK